jgi:hypothetical protein
MRGKKRRIVDYDLGNNIEPFSPDEIETPAPLGFRCNKDKLVQICDVLGIDKSVVICPNSGFTEEAMYNETQALQRENRIVRLITKSICDLVCPSNVKFQSSILASETNTDQDFQLLVSNASKLVFLAIEASRLSLVVC